MKYNKDKQLADLVCKGDEQALHQFYDIVKDDIYKAALRLNPIDYKEEKKNKSYSTKIGENVQDTVTWFWERTTKLCCKYKALAPLNHLIRTDLFHKRTRLQWIRHIKGKKGYVPEILKKNFSETHIKIFKELTYKRSTEEIISKLNLDESVYYDIYDEIESALIQANMLRLIQSEDEISLSEYVPDDKEITSAKFRQKSLSIENDELIKYVEKRIKRICQSLKKRERRILGLYMGHEYTPEKIYNILSDGNPIYIKEFQIKSDKDIVRLISKIEYKLFQYAKLTSDGFIEDNNIDKRIFRSLLKYYFLYKDPNFYN